MRSSRLARSSSPTKNVNANYQRAEVKLRNDLLSLIESIRQSQIKASLLSLSEIENEEYLELSQKLRDFKRTNLPKDAEMENFIQLSGGMINNVIQLAKKGHRVSTTLDRNRHSQVLQSLKTKLKKKEAECARLEEINVSLQFEMDEKIFEAEGKFDDETKEFFKDIQQQNEILINENKILSAQLEQERRAFSETNLELEKKLSEAKKLSLENATISLNKTSSKQNNLSKRKQQQQQLKATTPIRNNNNSDDHHGGEEHEESAVTALKARLQMLRERKMQSVIDEVNRVSPPRPMRGSQKKRKSHASIPSSKPLSIQMQPSSEKLILSQNVEPISSDELEELDEISSDNNNNNNNNINNNSNKSDDITDSDRRNENEMVENNNFALSPIKLSDNNEEEEHNNNNDDHNKNSDHEQLQHQQQQTYYWKQEALLGEKRIEELEEQLDECVKTMKEWRIKTITAEKQIEDLSKAIVKKDNSDNDLVLEGIKRCYDVLGQCDDVIVSSVPEAFRALLEACETTRKDLLVSKQQIVATDARSESQRDSFDAKIKELTFQRDERREEVVRLSDALETAATAIAQVENDGTQMDRLHGLLKQLQEENGMIRSSLVFIANFIGTMCSVVQSQTPNFPLSKFQIPTLEVSLPLTSINPEEPVPGQNDCAELVINLQNAIGYVLDKAFDIVQSTKKSDLKNCKEKNIAAEGYSKLSEAVSKCIDVLRLPLGSNGPLTDAVVPMDATDKAKCLQELSLSVIRRIEELTLQQKTVEQIARERELLSLASCSSPMALPRFKQPLFGSSTVSSSTRSTLLNQHRPLPISGSVSKITPKAIHTMDNNLSSHPQLSGNSNHSSKSNNNGTAISVDLVSTVHKAPIVASRIILSDDESDDDEEMQNAMNSLTQSLLALRSEVKRPMN